MHTHTHTHTHTHISIRRLPRKNYRMQAYQVYNIWQTRYFLETVTDCITTGSVFLTDSAFGTASARGQLKGVRPCQSIQECWQTARNLCASACVSAALDEQRADLSPSQTLLIKAGNVCNLSKLWPKDFARCDVCFSVSMLPPPPTTTRIVGLILPRLSLPMPTWPACASLPCSADKCCLWEEQIAAPGISKQYLFKRGPWEVVMIYSIIPVETQELLCLHDSSVSSSHYMATDGLMSGTASLKTLLLLLSWVVLICSILWSAVIKCLWLPVAVLLFGAYRASLCGI